MFCLKTIMFEFTTLTVHEKSFLTSCGITPNVFYFNAFSLAFEQGLCFEFGPNHSLENHEYVKHIFSSNCALTRFMWGVIINILGSQRLQEIATLCAQKALVCILAL